MYQLVENEQKYWMTIRNLRMNPQNIKGFITKEYISDEEQESYMQKKGHRYFVCLFDDIPVGFIGFNKDSDITIAVDPEYQKNGIGSFMLNSVMDIVGYLRPKVLKHNITSIMFFVKNGFEIIDIKEDYYVFEKYQA